MGWTGTQWRRSHYACSVISLRSYVQTTISINRTVHFLHPHLSKKLVYNDYNVTSMEALLTLLKDTKNPSHKYVPPSLLSEENSSASVTDVKFADMYPPYEDLGVLQGLVAMAIVATDIALLLWIVGSLVFFWRSAVDVICNPLDGRHIVCEDKWSYSVSYKEGGNEDTKDADRRREELLGRLEAIRKEIHNLLDRNAETNRQLTKRNTENEASGSSKQNQKTLHVSKPPNKRKR